VSHSGGCLCGEITFRTESELRPVLHCHCVNCQRTSGNFVAATGCPTDELEISDPSAKLRWYDLGYCRYGFCVDCGSQLFWQGAEHMDHTSIKTGVLDDAEGLELAGIWFVDDAQSHLSLDDSVPHHTGNG